METYQLRNEAETISFGERIGAFLKPNDVIILDGDLGAGKTTLTKGIAKFLGIQRYVKSPTYTIVHEYRDGRIPLFHIDAYRLEEGGADDIGFDEYFDGNGVTVVEWPQYIEEYLPEEYLKIALDRNSDNTQRFLTVEPNGARYEKIEQAIEDEVNGR
ncbi:tRNA (adenosine(37)-N6)-threonylcarbamoyltransferase complex ATPase subunit type 1 TsaE [Pediococcus stilesii]|uniref:tRNA threonylcarbamoyladenosine biosynthesis protein TsaE n=1 Tax=Pediococcus stilesii TaxID=331679 RepID=A0A0R2L4E8_9LACO|nr:tRNA (adenosine(37)-N6)-threonylcarbamoyltransferase complex ATPase subunit type 1 TsaE [Pediococcus stilesii]KRN94789.1 ATP GTP hydrolase [Pediococcus stilesii]